MTTFRELIYMCLDLTKNISDDATYTEDHVRFLLKKYRNYLIEQKNSKQNGYQSDDNKQEINIQDSESGLDNRLESIINEDHPHYKHNGSIEVADDKSTNYIRTRTELPKLLNNSLQVYSMDDLYSPMITYVSPDRIKYVCRNKWLDRFVYCSIMGDKKLYFKGKEVLLNNILEHGIKIYGVFEDPEDVLKFNNPDITYNELLDSDFPIDNDLIPLLIQSVVKDLLGASYRPKDPYNNALDDLANISQFIRTNMKDRFVKDYQDGGE